MSATKKQVMGIDLGTTYSCVGVWSNDRVEIVSNDHGNRTTPSWVAFTETERLIGEAAKNQVASNPTNTVFDAKRFIGRKFSDKTILNDIRHVSTQVVDVGDKPHFRVSYKGGNQGFFTRRNQFNGIKQDERDRRVLCWRRDS